MAIVTYLSGLFTPVSWSECTKNGTPEHLPDPPADRLQLGAHAKRLLEDPVLALAFDKLADDLAQTWRSSQVGDREGREEAYRMVWAIEGARSKLRALLGDAKLIEAEHARREKEEERKRERAA